MSARRRKHKRYTRCDVEVFVNGEALLVPTYVESCWAARGALGLMRADSVAHEDRPESALEFKNGHTFSRGERFITMIIPAPHITPAEATTDSGEELELEEDSAAPWESDPDWWRR